MGTPEAVDKYMQTSLAFINRTVQLHHLEQSDPNSEEAKFAREQLKAHRAGLLLRIENVMKALEREERGQTVAIHTSPEYR
jgi:hypothetical protein